jgi:hypothetical protein
VAKTLADAQVVIASDLALIECDRVLILVVVLDELQGLDAVHRQARLNAVSACWTLLTLGGTLPFSCPFRATRSSKPQQAAAQSEGPKSQDSTRDGVRSGSVRHTAAKGG